MCLTTLWYLPCLATSMCVSPMQLAKRYENPIGPVSTVTLVCCHPAPIVCLLVPNHLVQRSLLPHVKGASYACGTSVGYCLETL